MIASPMSQRPLGSADPLYVARPGLEKPLWRALELGLNVAVTGDAGVGKTTLVKSVLGALPTPQRIIWVDGLACAVNELVDRIAGGFGWTRRAYRLEPKFPITGIVEATMKRVPIEPDPTRVDPDDLPFLAQVIADAPETLDIEGFDGRWICVVDTPPPGAIEGLFGRHREQLWDLPVQWIVITRVSPLSAGADLFFEAEVSVTDLPVELATRLVELRLNASGAIRPAETTRLATAIATQVPARPRDLVAAARDALLYDTGVAEERFKVQGELVQKAAVLGRGHSMLMAELISLGGTHASDTELQKRLGYSRPRIVQLLSDLERARLVTRQPEGRRVTFAPSEHVP